MKPIFMKHIFSLCILLASTSSFAQLLSRKTSFTKADTVRGTYNEYRTWWDLKHYNLYIHPEISNKSIQGFNEISFTVLKGGNQKMQIDLQKPMQIDSVIMDGEPIKFIRWEQAYLLSFGQEFVAGREKKLTVYFQGSPKVAVMPPWDGGLIWTQDDKGNPWISVACQGLGASVWWPCKDHDMDEPDNGAKISLHTLANMVAVSNGKLLQVIPGDNYNTYEWEVKSPINNYSITLNIGDYVHFDDVYKGLKGDLSLQFWFLKQHESIAKKHLLEEAKEMLKSFEYWFGPYPFYEDGYKLIETPFLGMEHQSGIAYGNNFKKGYLGRDLSKSGWGLKWDFILIHESGHEWFGNNITAKDVADMWIHEGFTTYSEVLFVETKFGKKAAEEYVQGLRANIQNDKPIIGTYGVHKEGSGDMYFKGAQIIHTYRQILNDDVKFRDMLHEMNSRFYHKSVSTQEVESLMQEYTDVNLSGFFTTYLRTSKVPTLNYKVEKSNSLKLWFTDVSDDFSMPVDITVNGINYRTDPIGNLSGDKSVMFLPKPDVKLFVQPNYYIKLDQ